jgi:hypothetical protein
MDNDARVVVILVVALMLVLFMWVLIEVGELGKQLSNCTCNVSYGGHTMSVEDALERSGEGLTIHQ